MGKQKIIIVVIVLFVTVSGIFYSVNYEKEEAVFIAEEITSDESMPEITDSLSEENIEEADSQKNNQSQIKETQKELIYVHICGQVMKAGVYCLEAESRVTDLIELAGGFTEKAARDYVNLAQKLSDGQKVYIPALDEISESNPAGGTGSLEQQDNASAKVNINIADKDTLMTLTGIGEAKAEAIIRYREKNGSFGSIEELKQIEGIKDGVFNKIKDEIEV